MKKKKISKRRLKKKKRIRKFLLFVIMIISLYLFTFKTDFFNIKNIEVLGNKKISYEQIVKASMSIKGENIFKTNIKKGKENLEKLSYLKNCTIKRNLPREIIIEIEERQELAILAYNNSYIYIDREGYILTIEEKKGESKLPEISGLELKGLEPGDNIFDMLDIANAEEFIAYSEELKLISYMKYINFLDEKNIMIELNDEIKVAFGPLDNVKYKLSFLYKILEDIDEKDIQIKQILFNKGSSPIIIRDNR